MPRPPADTDTTKRSNILGIPGFDSLPVQFPIRIEAKTERDRNLACNSLEAAQVTALTGCNAGFLLPQPQVYAAIKAFGTIDERWHVDIDYDSQREFDASNTFNISYQGVRGDRLQRVDVGNITFAAPPSRFMTSTMPAGNYGVMATNQFGALQLKSVFARQTGNVVLN
ncbi:MAG: hypothetical protein ACREPM_24375, partial [Gemmatimonadaceae bacterium]